MIYVDIIIPFHSSVQKYLNFQFYTYRRNSYWFPVWYFRKEIRKMGLEIRFLNLYGINYNKISDIVGIDGAISNSSKYMISLLKKIRERATKIIWFDHEDSTGKIRYSILPYVDQYYKRQLLKDRSLYKKRLYNRRLFTDFYSRNYNVDKKKEFLDTKTLKDKYIQKIGLSWNFALSDYRKYNRLTKYLNVFSTKMNLKYQEPSLDRRFEFSANFKTNYATESVAFQRKQLIKLLNKRYKNNNYISTGFLPKNVYLNVIRQSKAVFSPFGYGEICLRDFEAFIAGSALIKPKMDHIETWPNLYKENETYIALPWNVEKWDEKINEILVNEKFLFKIAKNGQKLYKEIWTSEGIKEFCNRFINLITFKSII